MIRLVGFDGDDTLWHSEGYYRQAQAEFEAIVGKYVDLADANLHERLLQVERSNLKLFGYGAKGMALSMIEAAVAVTHEKISATDLHRIVGIGKGVLAHPVELLPDIRAAVEEVAQSHPVVLITKGDLFHQEAKVAASGLSDLFRRIEIVSEKDRATYTRLFAEFGVQPEGFVMVGNSLRSDIEPVLRLGGWGVHMPYHVTWAHEQEHGVTDADAGRMVRVDSAAAIPAAIGELHQRALARLRGRG
ncbi:HAD family hydrolase [Arenimonas fontis]|uniref:HAD family hydrolase n=1 Tax=Arenimonas fontis TaxID=2608255 RepID=A0A5B2Z7U4_9GAMM|nr:HAD family hydrolase [Arenimonas fontis]KAA2283967.1 HAD family hydrolase [Arenimonas fontis]